MSRKKYICKKVHSFHHYLTWFLAPMCVPTPYCMLQNLILHGRDVDVDVDVLMLELN